MRAMFMPLQIICCSISTERHAGPKGEITYWAKLKPQLTDSADDAGLADEMGRLADVQAAQMLEIGRRRTLIQLLLLPKMKLRSLASILLQLEIYSPTTAVFW